MAARRWSAEHAALLSTLLQIHAQLRGLQRAMSDADPSTVAHRIELNAKLARLAHRLDRCCELLGENPKKRGGGK